MAKNLKLNSDKIDNLEKFIGGMALSGISLNSILGIQTSAFRHGLLNDEEEELSRGICYELTMTAQMIKQLCDLILERCPMDNELLQKEVAKMARIRKKEKVQDAKDEQL